jgi:hypothetical protein
VSLFFRYFGQQLVHLRDVDPHEPAQDAPPLPPGSTCSRIRNPVRAEGTDPYVPVRAHTPSAGDVAPDVRLRKVGDPRHEKEIPVLLRLTPAGADRGGLKLVPRLALGPWAHAGGRYYYPADHVALNPAPVFGADRGRVDGWQPLSTGTPRTSPSIGVRAGRAFRSRARDYEPFANSSAVRDSNSNPTTGSSPTTQAS